MSPRPGRNRKIRGGGGGGGGKRGGKGKNQGGVTSGRIEKPKPFFKGGEKESDKNVLADLIPFQKNLYEPHPAVVDRSPNEVAKYRRENGITVKGSAPNTIQHFEEVSFPDQIMRIRKGAGNEPTPIEAQVWPIAMSGLNMLCVTKVRPGKILAYILPAIMHIKKQPPLEPGDGPIVLVLTGYRESVLEISQVAKDYGAELNIRKSCVFGGPLRKDQVTPLLKGSEILIATPARLVNFLDKGITNLRRCTYVVLDETERMLEMQFGSQIRQIMREIRPDRQTLMWTAAWSPEVQKLTNDILDDYIQVNIGSLKVRTNRIHQIVDVCREDQKEEKLKKLLTSIYDEANPSKIIIFAAKRARANRVGRYLAQLGLRFGVIHGHKSQAKSDAALKGFRAGTVHILTVTNVTSRNFGIDGIKYVINYDYTKPLEEYVRRIGCIDCSQEGATAYTFFTKKDASQAKALVHLLKQANQEVTPVLANFAKTIREEKKLKYVIKMAGGGVGSKSGVGLSGDDHGSGSEDDSEDGSDDDSMQDTGDTDRGGENLNRDRMADGGGHESSKSLGFQVGKGSKLQTGCGAGDGGRFKPDRLTDGGGRQSGNAYKRGGANNNPYMRRTGDSEIGRPGRDGIAVRDDRQFGNSYDRESGNGSNFMQQTRFSGVDVERSNREKMAVGGGRESGNAYNRESRNDSGYMQRTGYGATDDGRINCDRIVSGGSRESCNAYNREGGNGNIYLQRTDYGGGDAESFNYERRVGGGGRESGNAYDRESGNGNSYLQHTGFDGIDGIDGSFKSGNAYDREAGSSKSYLQRTGFCGIDGGSFKSGNTSDRAGGNGNPYMQHTKYGGEDDSRFSRDRIAVVGGREFGNAYDHDGGNGNSRMQRTGYGSGDDGRFKSGNAYDREGGNGNVYKQHTGYDRGDAAIFTRDRTAGGGGGRESGNAYDRERGNGNRYMQHTGYGGGYNTGRGSGYRDY